MRSVPFGVLLLAEMPRMQPRGLGGVVAAVQVVTVGEIGLTGCLVVLPRPVVTCRRAVMLGGMLEMFGGFSVMSTASVDMSWLLAFCATRSTLRRCSPDPCARLHIGRASYER